MSMRRLSLGLGILVTSFSSSLLPVEASSLQPSHFHSVRENFIAQVDQSALIKENKELLIKNGTLALTIAGITSPLKIPTSGAPLKQNESLILQNQETFKAIAKKVGATVPSLPGASGADQAEKNHKLLLQNRSIIVAVLKKLGIPPAPAPELTGTFVDKNNTLLVANGKALAKIAAKLGM
jgi:hypothetical protein